MEVHHVDIEDLQDIHASLGGDGEAYGRLVRRHQQAIARYVWRFSREPGVCEELVQEVFVQAFFSLRSFRGRSPFAHWLRRIATRVGYRYWKDRRRDRERTQPLDADACVLAAAGNLAAGEAAEAVHSLLGRLAPRDRLVLTLMHLEGLSTEEIADLTGWTRTLVKVQAHRARRRLRAMLEQQE